jgi:hypothetical protein
VVLVVQLGLIFHFILNPEQRRVFQLVLYINTAASKEWNTVALNGFSMFDKFVAQHL